MGRCFVEYASTSEMPVLSLIFLVNYPDNLQVFHEYLSITLFVLKPLKMSLLI